MKVFKIFNKAFLLVLVALTGLCLFGKAQDNKNNNREDKSQEIAALLQSRKFAFVAQNANPMGGRYINLTSPYGITISNDSLTSDLPYFGRAYTASLNPSEGGIHFTSTNFNYEIKEKKKGGWDVVITPKGTRDVRQMFLSVTEKGYASLQVTSNTRQLISFSGYLSTKNNFR